MLLFLISFSWSMSSLLSLSYSARSFAKMATEAGPIISQLYEQSKCLKIKILQNMVCMPLAGYLLVCPAWFKSFVFAIRGIIHYKRILF